MRLFTLIMVSALWWMSYQAFAKDQNVSKLLSGDESRSSDQLEVQTLKDALLSIRGPSTQQGTAKACDEVACDERSLRKEIANQLFKKYGHAERIHEIELKDFYVFAWCEKDRVSFEGSRYSELKFAFDKVGGPTFREVNIIEGSRFNMSSWGWYSLDADLSPDDTLTISDGDNTMLRYNREVSRDFVDGLRNGVMWSWTLFQDTSRPPMAAVYRFDASAVSECIRFIDE